MELLSDSKFNLVETKELIVNNMTLYKIQENTVLNVEDSGLLYIIESNNSRIKISLPEVSKGLNYSFIVSDDGSNELEFYTENEIVGNKYLFRSDVSYKENINNEYSLIIKKLIKGDSFKFICDDKKYYLVNKKEALNSINSNIHNYPLNYYYKVLIINNRFVFKNNKNEELNNLIKGNTYNFVIENNKKLNENNLQIIFLKTEIIENNYYPKFKYIFTDLFGNNITKVNLYKNTQYVFNCTDKSNNTIFSSSLKKKEIKIETIYSDEKIRLTIKNEEGEILKEPLLLNRDIEYRFLIIDTELINKIKLMNGSNQITTNDNINFEMYFRAETESRGGFKVNENHLINLEIVSSNNTLNNKKINIYILEKIIPELIDSSNNIINFNLESNNIYKVGILNSNDVKGIRGRYDTNDINLSELAIDKHNIEIIDNIKDLLKLNYEGKEVEEISKKYYKDLEDNEKINYINSNIGGINDENYIIKMKINYNLFGSLEVYSTLKNNIEKSELNIYEEIIDNNYSGKLISLDNSEDIEINLGEPSLGNKFKFIIINDNILLKDSEKKFIVELVVINNELKYKINGEERKEIILYSNNKYIFDLNNLYYEGIYYDFKLSIIEDGIHNYGNEYKNNNIVKYIEKEKKLEIDLYNKRINEKEFYYYSEKNTMMGNIIKIKNIRDKLKSIKIRSNYDIISNIPKYCDNNISLDKNNINNENIIKINKGTKGKYIEILSLSETEYIVNDTNINYNSNVVNLPFDKKKVVVKNEITNGINSIKLLDENNNDVSSLFKNIEYEFDQSDFSNIGLDNVEKEKNYYIKIVRDNNIKNKFIYKFKIYEDSEYKNIANEPLILYRGIKYTFYQYDDSNKNLESNNIVIEDTGILPININEILVEKNNMILSVVINNGNLVKYWSYSLDDSKLYKILNKKSISIRGLYKKIYKVSVYGHNSNGNIICVDRKLKKIEDIDENSAIYFEEDEVPLLNNDIKYNLKLFSKILNNEPKLELKIFDEDNNEIEKPLSVRKGNKYNFNLTDSSLYNVNFINHIIKSDEGENMVDIYVKIDYEKIDSIVNNIETKTYNFYGFKYYSDNNFSDEIENPLLLSKNNNQKKNIKYNFYQNNNYNTIEDVLLKIYIVPEDYIYDNLNIVNNYPKTSFYLDNDTLNNNTKLDYLFYKQSERTLEVNTESDDLIEFYKKENNNVSIICNENSKEVTVNTYTNHYEKANNYIVLTDVYDTIEVLSITSIDCWFNITAYSNKIHFVCYDNLEKIEDFNSIILQEEWFNINDIICINDEIIREIVDIEDISNQENDLNEKILVLNNIVDKEFKTKNIKKMNNDLNGRFLIKSIESDNSFKIELNDIIDNNSTYYNCSLNKNNFLILEISNEINNILSIKVPKFINELINNNIDDNQHNKIILNNTDNILNNIYKIYTIVPSTNSIEIKLNHNIKFNSTEYIKTGTLSLSQNYGRYYKSVVFMDTDINNDNVIFNNYINYYSNEKKNNNKIYIIPSVDIKISKYEYGLLDNKLNSYEEGNPIINNQSTEINYNNIKKNGIVYNRGELNATINDTLINDINTINNVYYNNNKLYIYGTEYINLDKDNYEYDINNKERSIDDYCGELSIPIIITDKINIEFSLNKNGNNYDNTLNNKLDIMISSSIYSIGNKTYEFKYLSINNVPEKNNVETNSDRIFKIEDNNIILNLKKNNYDEIPEVEIYTDKYAINKNIYNNINDLNLHNRIEEQNILVSFSNKNNIDSQKLYIFPKKINILYLKKDSDVNDNKLYISNNSVNKDIYSGSYIIIYNNEKNFYLKKKNN